MGLRHVLLDQGLPALLIALPLPFPCQVISAQALVVLPALPGAAEALVEPIEAALGLAMRLLGPFALNLDPVPLGNGFRSPGIGQRGRAGVGTAAKQAQNQSQAEKREGWHVTEEVRRCADDALTQQLCGV